jgi:hypothetical protein
MLARHHIKAFASFAFLFFFPLSLRDGDGRFVPTPLPPKAFVTSRAGPGKTVETTQPVTEKHTPAHARAEACAGGACPTFLRGAICAVFL